MKTLQIVIPMAGRGSRFVVELGVIENSTLCGDDSFWKITDKALLECENSSS